MISCVKSNVHRVSPIYSDCESPSSPPPLFPRSHRAKTPMDFISERSELYCHLRRSLSHSVATSGISSYRFFLRSTRRCNDLRLDDRGCPQRGRESVHFFRDALRRQRGEPFRCPVTSWTRTGTTSCEEKKKASVPHVEKDRNADTRQA